jgi:hypothetical protein
MKLHLGCGRRYIPGKRREVARVLGEWYRVLVPGGRVRISVPDFTALREVHPCTRDRGLVIAPVFGRQDYLYNIHSNLLDFDSLKNELILQLDRERGVLTGLNVGCRRPAP